MEVSEILSLSPPEAISLLKRKSISIPPWSALRIAYEPERHRIVTDRIGRRDKATKRGHVEKASRISVGVEQLLVKRMTELMFAIPVQRNYANATEEAAAQAAVAVERIFKVARIDSANISRFRSYFASCETATVWYAVPKKHNLYGFPADFKLRCASYSPMDGYALYPLLDEYGDMKAFSLEYAVRTSGSDELYFETYAEDRHVKWRLTGTMPEPVVDERLTLGKIPCIYISRPRPIFHGTEHLREEIEYTLSRNSDVVAYNAAPILKVSGALNSMEEKGESRRIVQVENGGDVSYVSWSQAAEIVKWHIDEMFHLIFMQTQIPDISFDNLSSLGAIGYDARKTLLTDAHLKVGDESGAAVEFLDREVSVVKSFLKMLRPELGAVLDGMDVDNIITPYVQDDDTQNVNRLTTANGGKPLMSQLDSIRLAGYSADPQATLDQINREAAQAQAAQMQAMMAGGSYQ